ncbi:MAG: GyrI-like domain-containing protein [Bacteroidetes bacterium]|nr:GyrI-like domain-containing protein [Bacteroidota bacterium]
MAITTSLKNKEPEIFKIAPKIVAGNSLEMSISDNKTAVLWGSFMPRLGEIRNRIDSVLLSIQVFPDDFNFANFDIHKKFIKWAGVEIKNVDTIPPQMELLSIPAGEYAVFTHIGDTATAENTFRYIFSVWLPNSAYVLDNRPQFEVLGEKYKRNDPASEEDIYIPIKPKE